MAAFFYRVVNPTDYVAPDKSYFNDVKKGDQFYTEINWLAEQKITEGWKEGDTYAFRPTTPIARDAMAAFLYRYDQKRYTA